MTDIAERLRARNIRTIYLHEDTAELRDEPPAEGVEAWLPFTIRRVNQEKLARDGLWLVYAEHELEKEGRSQLKEAQAASEQYDKTFSGDEQARRRKPMPTPHLENDVVRTYVADRGNLMVLLMDGMLEPLYVEVKDFIKPYEQALARAIVNFSGAAHDPKAPPPSSSS